MLKNSLDSNENIIGAVIAPKYSTGNDDGLKFREILQKTNKSTIFIKNQNELVKVVSTMNDVKILYEAMLASSHANIVHIFAVEEVDAKLHITMRRYYEDLRRFSLNGNLLNFGCASFVAVQIANALHHIHINFKICHLDVKPENIFIKEVNDDAAHLAMIEALLGFIPQNVLKYSYQKSQRYVEFADNIYFLKKTEFPKDGMPCLHNLPTISPATFVGLLCSRLRSKPSPTEMRFVRNVRRCLQVDPELRWSAEEVGTEFKKLLYFS